MATTTAAKSPPGALYEQAAQFQADLDLGVSAAHDQMLASWSQAYGATREEYAKVLDKIAQAQAAGTPVGPSWLYEKARLKNLLDTTKAQVHTFAQQASQATVAAHDSAVKAAAKAHAKMGVQALQEAGIAAGFTQVNPENLKHLVGYLADGSPVSDLFAGMGDQAAAQAKAVLVKGVTLGKGVDWMSRRLDKALDVPRWRAETIVRTEAQRVYRSVARDTYMANADVLEGWTWVAHLDTRCCGACVAMDGTHHAVGSTLDGHPRCRCAMVPRTKSWEDLGIGNVADQRPPVRSGLDWLANATPSVQRAVMGPGKYRAWKAGKMDLEDLVARTSDPKWGTMRRERSLREIRLGQNPNYADVIEAPAPKPPVLRPDPEKVQALADTYDLETIEHVLKDKPFGPLTDQQLLDYRAAHAVQVSKLTKGPTFRLPEPDAAWANTATEKMNAAVLNKGYPSKGYSQTVAIYKAKANGTVGTKVGVVKSLSWQEKVNAQQALKDHDAWLEQHLATKAAAKAEGKGVVKYLDDDLAAAQGHTQALAYLDDADTAAGFLLDPMEAARTKAIIAAKRAKYLDEQAEALGLREASPEWVHPKGTHLTIDKDGWGTYEYQGTTGVMSPGKVAEALKGDKSWDVPKVEPNPVNVASLVKHSLTDADGYYDQAAAKGLQDVLDNPEAVVKLPAQTVADWHEAIAVAKSSVPWKPEPHYVETMVKLMDDDPTVKPYLQNTALKDPSITPVGKANIQEAIKQHDAKVAQAAKIEAENALKATDPWAITPDTLNGAQQAAKGPLSIGDVVTKGKTGKVQYEIHKDLGDGTYLVKKPGTKTPQATTPYAAKDLNLVKAKGDVPTPAVQPNEPVTFGAAPDPSTLKDTGKVLGTHGAKVYEGPAGTKWLFKPPKDPADGFLTTLDEAASRLQAQTGLKAPDTFVTTLGGKRGSLQRMFDAKDAFPAGLKPGDLSQADLLAVQKEQVLDWLLSNHDGHHQQFLRLPNGDLVGIDKGQAFRWMGQDRLDWDFHPNAAYGAPEPVYNTLWRAFAKGEGKADVLDPNHGPLADYIKSVQGISDDEIRAMFRPYAEQAAARGRLAVPQSYPGLKPATLPKGDVEAFLDAIVARKNDLAKDFDALYAKAAKARQAALPDWKPTKPTPSPTRKVAQGKAAWKDAPQPEKPKPPTPPDVAAADVFDGWLGKVKAKYEAFAPGKTLETSNNWVRVNKVIQDRDRVAAKELLDRHYLDDDLYQEAIRLIDKADQVAAEAKAAHDTAVAAYDKALKAWKRDLQDWRDANGIKVNTLGMDDDVKRHGTNAAGTKWADSKMKNPGWTTQEQDTLQEYTGGVYSTWNSHLRKSKGQPTQYGTSFERMDSAMVKSAIPEDVILHRGTGVDSFHLDGRLLTGTDRHRLKELVGTIQQDHGYTSTSVGAEAAFNSYAVQIKFRAPAGTPAAYVKAFSHFGNEREVILARGTRYYVHAVYEKNGQVVVEAEIILDEAFDAASAIPAPSLNPFKPRL